MKDAELKDKTQKARRCKRQVDCVVIPPPYYKDDYVTIYNADCLDILPSLAPDVIITDPPYPDKYVDEYKYFDGILNFLAAFDCRQLIFWSAKSKFPMDYTAIHIWDRKNTIVPYERIYERNGNKKYKVYSFLHLQKGNRVTASLAQDVLTEHPSQKPIKLMSKLVSEYTRSETLIIDPFMGTGSTLLAAKNLERKAIGIELNEKWCKVAADRLAQGILPL